MISNIKDTYSKYVSFAIQTPETAKISSAYKQNFSSKQKSTFEEEELLDFTSTEEYISTLETSVV